MDQSAIAMTTTLLLELFAGFMAACLALWFVALSRPSLPRLPWLLPLVKTVRSQVLRPGVAGSLGLLLLRLSVGLMMIHHGQEKLADPQQFADTYVASLHLPFPLPEAAPRRRAASPRGKPRRRERSRLPEGPTSPPAPSVTRRVPR